MYRPRTTSHNRTHVESIATQRDQGYTLIELLVIMIVLGILATVVVMAVVGGVKAQATESSCAGERRQLITASESYFALTRTQTLPATGTGHDRFEQTLVDHRLLRSVSAEFDLDASGELTAETGSPC